MTLINVLNGAIIPILGIQEAKFQSGHHSSNYTVLIGNIADNVLPAQDIIQKYEYTGPSM